MLLPDKFIEKYTRLLGSEAADFLETFSQEAVTGFRINPLKKIKNLLLTRYLTHLGDIMEKFPENRRSMSQD